MNVRRISPLAFVAIGAFAMLSLRASAEKPADDVANLFADPKKAKTKVISAILDDFPKRRFVLIGDSGERDPQVYAHLARMRPKQILHVFIRAVKPEHAVAEGFREVFRGVDDATWTVFQKASELPAKLAPTGER